MTPIRERSLWVCDNDDIQYLHPGGGILTESLANREFMKPVLSKTLSGQAMTTKLNVNKEMGQKLEVFEIISIFRSLRTGAHDAEVGKY